MEEKKEYTELESEELLAQVLNNTPAPIEIAGKTYYITALKLGVQNLIAEESVKIQKAEDGNMLDLYKMFAQSVPAVIRCIAYAVLNDKDKIFKDYATRQYSDEFQSLYEKLEWESDRNQFMEILVNVMQRLDLSFFYRASTMLTTMRDSALKTRKKMKGLILNPPTPKSGK